MKEARQIALETLERYTGCHWHDFQPNLILTNFPPYVEYFAKSRNLAVHEGAMFKVAHCKKDKITIIDFKIGSPAAALIVDLCSFLYPNAAIFLGMCGGLRRRYKIGDFLVPVASIRGEGTSDHYFPPEVPALANFLVQKAVTEVMEKEKVKYHVGITYTTNMRFWEFNDNFIEKIKISRAQGIEMECAALFIASYKRRLNLGALLLISDLPLKKGGKKTKKMAKFVFDNYTKHHVELGVSIIKEADKMLSKKVKGYYSKKDEEERFPEFKSNA
jgi:AMP nucleosidase